MNDLFAICREGLWRNNPGLVQLLGLCPLLAVTTTVVNALGLGLATMLTLLVSNVLVSASRGLLRPEIRIPVYVLIIASAVSVVELVMRAWFHGLYEVLGIFIPLIVTNCTIVARAEAFASRQPVRLAALDGLMMGLGFALVLLAVGGLRELFGRGTLLAQAELMFGPRAADWALALGGGYPGILLLVLPPGAFLALGLLLAAKRWLDERPAPATRAAARRAAGA